MKAVILAGGKGTRMGEHTRDIPKPMLKIGDVPILEHQIELLHRYDIKDIIILVNHLKDSIIEYFGNGESFGVNIEYYEEPFPMGTVGGVKEVEDQLESDFLVLYGDVMIDMNIRRLLLYHFTRQSDCTLVLHPNDHPFDSDLVETNENGLVTGFNPKPHKENQLYKNLVNAGMYVFSPKIFPLLEKGKKADFGRDIFPAIYNKINMFGYNTAEYLKDMGTPKRWDEVTGALQSGKIKHSNYDYKQKAIFLDRDGVVNVERSYIQTPEALELYPETCSAVKAINKSDYKAIVVTNQALIARNMCTLDELGEVHKKLETDLGNNGAFIDGLYYCPHHPDKGFPEERPEYKIDCECRKPKPGMLLKAAEEFNIDLKKSFMIGDTERDIVAGERAGCTTIGVATGYGLRNTAVLPDFFFSHIGQAVNFIMNEPYRWVYEKLINEQKKVPEVILIGGNARSGKSTLASYIKWKFEQNGKNVCKIELDNWILSEGEREGCKNVYDRFNATIMVGELQKILAGMDVRKPTYPKHPEHQAIDKVYRYKGEDVIIIEGVVALSFSELRDLATRKIFVTIDSDMHFKRFAEYYQWRGRNNNEIKKLYAGRTKDEYVLIEKESKFADFIVNNNL